MRRRVSSRFSVFLLLLLAAPASGQDVETYRELDGMVVVPFESTDELQMGLTRTNLERHREACLASGSRRCSTERFHLEVPAIDVIIDGFLIDQYEVSRAQYQFCIEAGACPSIDEANCQIYNGDDWGIGRELPPESLEPDVPRTCVTRDEATVYCNWVGGRLPTEAEWSLAAGSPRVFPWGGTFDPDAVAYLDSSSPPHLVGARDCPDGATPEGLHHMGGNAYEWVVDDACTYDAFPVGENPVCRSLEDTGVVRGGSFLSDSGGIRTTYRRFMEVDARLDTNGFRCVVSSHHSPSILAAPHIPHLEEACRYIQMRQREAFAEWYRTDSPDEELWRSVRFDSNEVFDYCIQRDDWVFGLFPSAIDAVSYNLLHGDLSLVGMSEDGIIVEGLVYADSILPEYDGCVNLSDVARVDVTGDEQPEVRLSLSVFAECSDNVATEYVFTVVDNHLIRTEPLLAGEEDTLDEPTPAVLFVIEKIIREAVRVIRKG